jgi:hypothetical protein
MRLDERVDALGIGVEGGSRALRQRREVAFRGLPPA